MTSLQQRLLKWYARFGRSHLPWRQTRDPYRVLVSEVMLQQTQVDRVIPKYNAFVERFPDASSLASSGTAEVLRMWTGLGYNSRAIRLKEVAHTLVARFNGTMPRDAHELQSLPGVGPYTAAAIRAFAFNLDDVAIDTNVRRVVHRLLHGMEYPAQAPARELDIQAHELVPDGRAHDWNSAMMDLGATLCTARAPKCLLCPIQRVCTAAPIDGAALDRARARFARPRSPQERLPFKETVRFARGRIVERLRRLPPGQRISLLDLHGELAEQVRASAASFRDIVAGLDRDGLVEIRNEAIGLKN